MNNDGMKTADSPEKSSASKIERALLALAALVFVTSIFVALNDNVFNRLFGESVEGQSIAKVKSSKNDVRRRNSSQQVWYPLTKNNEVYENDFLFAGKNSEALIELKNGTLLKLDPNTLITLAQKGDQLELSLKYGKFQGQLNKDQEIKVLVNGKTKTLKGTGDSEVAIESSPEGTAIQVLSGDIKVDEQDLTKDQQAAISEDGSIEEVKISEIELISPFLQQSFWRAPQQSLQLEWSEAANREYRVVISRNPNLSRPLVNQLITQTETYTFTPKNDGNYYWQVQLNQRGSNVKSVTSNFVWNQEKPIDLTYPPAQAQFTVDVIKDLQRKTYFWPEKKMTFVINDPTSAPIHQIEISTDREFQAQLIRRTTTDSRLEDIQLPNGSYYWRARVQAPDRPQALWSNTGEFSIVNKGQPIETPRLTLTQALAFQIPNQSYPKDFYSMNPNDLAPVLANYLEAKNIQLPELRFSQVTWSSGYEFEVKQLFDRGSAYKLQSLEPNYQLHLIRPGRFQVRAKALNSEQMQPSDWSPPINLQIKVAAPRTLTQPRFESTRTDAIQKKQSVLLKWTPTLYTKKYELQISESSSFRQAKRVFTTDPNQRISIDTNRSYFWRVRSLDQSRRAVSSFSQHFELLWDEEFIPPAPVLADNQDLVEEEVLEEEVFENPTLADLASTGKLSTSRAPRFFPWEVERKDPARRPNYWAKAGAGMSYQRLSTSSGTQSTSNSGINIPTASINVGASTGTWGVDLSYLFKKSDYSSQANPSIAQNSFTWHSFLLEGLYSIRRYFNFFGLKTETRVRAGVHRQSQPVLASNSTNTLDLLDATLTHLTLGADLILGRESRLRYELFMRYQHPLQASIDSNSSFSASPQYSLDGGVGLTYRMTPTSYLGVQWAAQLQKYAFSLQNGSTDADGDNSFIFSNIDTHFGFEF